ncbi:hypothetical protein O3M35_005347 [Rhynocoris fuscipes]|uniref:Uncharacterized protein n=1 Tax=Rhynocoris fuscipes TaxID=488301 RepID=A0AAW1DIC9_9HEMI
MFKLFLIRQYVKSDVIQISFDFNKILFVNNSEQTKVNYLLPIDYQLRIKVKYRKYIEVNEASTGRSSYYLI